MSESTVDSSVAAAARATMADARRAEHQVLIAVNALDAADAVAGSGYRRLERLLEDLWRLNPAHARRLVTRAALLTPQTTMSGQTLDPVLPATAAASAAGLVDDAHLRVIAATTEHLARIPGLAPDQFADAEASLAHHASRMAPAGLDRIARRIIDHLDPDGAAPPEPDEPIDELSLSRDPHGRLVIAGVVIGRADAELVTEVFDRLSAPAGPDDTRTLAQRRAEVLLDLCAQAASPTGIAAPQPDHPDEHAGDDGPDEHAGDDGPDEHAGDDGPGDDGPGDDGPGDDGPGDDGLDDDWPGDDGPGDDGLDDDWPGDDGPGDDGPDVSASASGTPRRSAGSGARRGRGCPTVPVLGRGLLAITIGYDQLRDRTGHGMLDSGYAVDPATARRLACDAGVVPVLLGTRSQPLDIGRLAYTVPDGIRRALHHRDRGCSFPGCTRRPARCHAHHLLPWLDGGDTALRNLTLLCRYHHHLIHHGGWTVQMIDGRPWYTPPAWIDPDRQPRPGGPRTAIAG